MRKMFLMFLMTMAGVAAALVTTIATASAATNLGTFTKPSTVSSYRHVVVWSAYDASQRQYHLAARVGGVPKTLAAPPQAAPFRATVSRGPDGRPLIVYPSCVGGACALHGIDPTAAGPPRVLIAATGSVQGVPALWGDRLAWAERSRGESLVRSARVGQDSSSVVARLGGMTVREVALLGRRLALNVADHSKDQQQVWLQELDGRRRHLVDHAVRGESGKAYVGLSFAGRALAFAVVCQTDQHGCASGAERYRNGHYEHAAIPADLGGFALGSGAAAFWMTRARYQQSHLQTTTLAFHPGRVRR